MKTGGAGIGVVAGGRRGVWIALIALVLLTGCGFKLRGQAQLPFSTAHIAGPAGSGLQERLARGLVDNGKRLVQRPAEAEVVIRLDKETRVKEILALSGGGKVREYRLRYEVTLTVQDGQGRDLLDPTRIATTRDFSFSDEQVLAKEAEEALLYRDMEQDILRQIQRQLAYIKR